MYVEGSAGSIALGFRGAGLAIMARPSLAASERRQLTWVPLAIVFARRIYDAQCSLVLRSWRGGRRGRRTKDHRQKSSG
jgi:hypothetical protein